MQATSGIASLSSAQIAYDSFGTGPAVLLIMGIGAQRVFWDERLCQRIAALGFRVIRFDHRDIGESSQRVAQADELDPPLKALGKRLVGAPIRGPYSLSDMAGDCAELLAFLGEASAHIVGISMGGMIAQHLALEFPAVVASLTLIMTTPGSRRFLPQPRAMKALLGRRANSEIEAIALRLSTFDIIGSPAYPMERERLTAIITQAYRRDSSVRGFLNHFAATLKSGDRTVKLANITARTLVIHGTADPLMPVSAGRELARLIPGAQWLPIAGMGHDFGEALWPFMVPAMHRLWVGAAR
ncbi:MAG: alpha/beta hydrolase [Kofleriaceae bacterium]|nr:alpha/beta hydrolase [Kofleriaceae bacterium]